MLITHKILFGLTGNILHRSDNQNVNLGLKNHCYYSSTSVGLFVVIRGSGCLSDNSHKYVVVRSGNPAPPCFNLGQSLPN